MLTPADMLLWTGLEVTPQELTSYEQSAAIQLKADGGQFMPSVMQTKALCYLVAADLEAKSGKSAMTSEHLGSYSYTRQSSTSGSVWLDLYYRLLAQFTAGGALPSSRNGGITGRIDKHMVSLNRRFSHGRGF